MRINRCHISVFRDFLNLLKTKLNPLRGSWLSVFKYPPVLPEVIHIHPDSGMEDGKP